MPSVPMVTELTEAAALPLTVEVETAKEPASWVMPERLSDMVAPPGTGMDRLLALVAVR